MVDTVGSVLNTGVRGVQSGFQRAETAAQSIASAATGEEVDLSEAAVDLIRSENQVKASARVIEVADRTIGSIIDIEV